MKAYRDVGTVKIKQKDDWEFIYELLGCPNYL